jgi:hypothetical protein
VCLLLPGGQQAQQRAQRPQQQRDSPGGGHALRHAAAGQVTQVWWHAFWHLSLSEIAQSHECVSNAAAHAAPSSRPTYWMTFGGAAWANGVACLCSL